MFPVDLNGGVGPWDQYSAMNIEQNKKALDIEVSKQITWEENAMDCGGLIGARREARQGLNSASDSV